MCTLYISLRGVVFRLAVAAMPNDSQVTADVWVESRQCGVCDINLKYPWLECAWVLGASSVVWSDLELL